ncbi:hypothetical protein BS50DRAFT_466656, partial [Corynespora cassiicola Philippines]
MSTTRKFPALSGACSCGLTRYRMETAPLYCYACHCLECQKTSGSAFLMAALIEPYCVTSIGPMRPAYLISKNRAGKQTEHAMCSRCHTILWGTKDHGGLLNVRIGTLDYPNIFEPDVHSFVESKVPWITLPKEAKTSKRQFDPEVDWPKQSMARYELFLARSKAQKNDSVKLEEPGVGQGGDETPTAGSPKERADEDEFEKRCLDMEESLQDRLEKLSLKLSE